MYGAAGSVTVLQKRNCLLHYSDTAVAVAIAGLAAVPMAASADTTLSGAVQLQLLGNDGPGNSGDARFDAGDVLVGVSASHELNSGLTGYGSLRIDLNRLSNAGTQTFDLGTPEESDDIRVGSAGTADSVFVGVKGGFGDIRIGEVPNAVEFGQLSTDIYDIAGEVNGGISYTGSFGPASIIAQFSPENNSDVIGVGAKFSLGGFNIGVGGENRGDNTNAAVGVSFAFSGASIAAHFWNKGVSGGDDITSFSVKAGYGFGGVSAGLTFTAQEDGGAIDDSAVRLDLGYGLGGGMDISTRIQTNSDNTPGGSDSSAWRLQLTKTF